MTEPYADALFVLVEHALAGPGLATDVDHEGVEAFEDGIEARRPTEDARRAGRDPVPVVDETPGEHVARRGHARSRARPPL